MANGIIVMDKPEGWTSHDVVAKIRGILHEKRVGHAGTLDPMATGVLPVFVGRATRAVEFAAETGKEYRAVLRLGITTDTQDSTGTILTQRPVTCTPAEVEAALAPFRGDILQLPPMYSALKRDGKCLYELARQGKTVERDLRPITIYELELEDRELPPGPEYHLRIRCSKGTYIRTLCHDIGEALGCGGVMSALRRTEAAGFTLENAITMDQLQAAAGTGAAADLLLPVDSYFARHPVLTADADGAFHIRNGTAYPCTAPAGTYRVYAGDGAFLMLGHADGVKMETIKSFFEVTL
ncbi:MAG: tRNA pseudouridine(55) synthase TruB [Pseudoflavonifractor sp.]